jgi:hypothetical protein
MLAVVLAQIGKGKAAKLPDFLSKIDEHEVTPLIRNVRQEALARFLRQLAQDESSKLPPILQGRFDRVRLTGALREHLKRLDVYNKQKPPGKQDKPDWGGWAKQIQADFAATAKVKEVPLYGAVEEAVRHELQNIKDAKRTNPVSRVKPNWSESARRILMLAMRGQSLSEEAGKTPWWHALGAE